MVSLRAEAIVVVVVVVVVIVVVVVGYSNICLDYFGPIEAHSTRLM